MRWGPRFFFLVCRMVGLAAAGRGGHFSGALVGRGTRWLRAGDWSVEGSALGVMVVRLRRVGR